MSGSDEEPGKDPGESGFFETGGVPFDRISAGGADLLETLSYARAYIESTVCKPPRPGGRGVLAVVLAVVMVTSMFAPIGAAAASNPDGFVGVPSDQVGEVQRTDNVPGDVGPPSSAGPPTDAGAWSVQATAYAGDLELDVAETSDGRPALVFTDDVNHDAREVAIRADTLRDAVGYRPEAAYGLHSSGDEWRDSIDYRDGYAVFEIPRFSSNTVTFDGEFSINATPAVDGDKFTYNTSNGGENLDINVTGSTAEEWDNETASGVVPDHTQSLSVGGNLEPTDGAGGDPVLEVTGIEGPAPFNASAATHSRTKSVGSETGGPTGVTFGDSGTKMFVAGVSENDVFEYDLSTAYNISTATYSQSVGVGTETGDIQGVTFGDSGTKMFVAGGSDAAIYEYDLSTAYDVSTATYSQNVNVSSEDGDVTGVAFGDSGTKMFFAGGSNANVYEYDLSTAYDVSTATYSQSVDVSSEEGDPEEVAVSDDGTKIFIIGHIGENVYEYDLSTAYDVSTATYSQRFSASNEADATTGVTFSGNGTMFVSDLNNNNIYEYALEAPPSGVEVVDGDGHSYSFGNFSDGETKTGTLNLQTSSTELNFSGDGGELNYTLEMQERTQTIDPVVDVNGNTTSHIGALADGEEVSLSTNDSWIVNGTNNVSVAAGDGTLSADAPTSEVGLNYTHDVVESRSVEYKGEAFSEMYSVSKTWLEDTDDAALEIPWASDRVIDVRDVEVEYVDGDGNHQSTTSDPAYTQENGTLIVELGDVPADWETTVKATGSKVQVHNGSITVLEATLEGESLDSKIEITDKGTDFTIEVGETAEGERVHYTAKESWSDAKAYARITSTGEQYVHVPGAQSGSTTRLRTLPLEVQPESGDAEVEVESASEPRFKVRPGDSTDDALEAIWHDTLSGERYVLVKHTADGETAVDADTAASPVYLAFDDSSGTYTIEQRDADPSEPKVTGPGGADGSGGIPPWVLLLAVASLSISGLWLVSRRVEGERGIRGNALLIVGGSTVAIIALELVTADSFLATLVESILGSITAALGGAATSTAGTLMIGIGVLLGLWLLDQRTERSIPTWIIALAGVAITVWFVETLAPGALLGPLSSSLEEIGPLVWMSILAGGGYLAYKAIQARRAPDTAVTFEVGDQ